MNKLQLEGLVKAGAFDNLEKNRKKLFVSIPKIIQNIKKINEDRNNNQTNLFNDNPNIKEENFELNYKKDEWSKKEMLIEEFSSLGFYISDHPLNEYQNLFSQLKINSYKDFIKNEKNEALVAGTIMSIVEKKSSKGTPFAIIKFSDNSGEFELFIFSEILINNREKLKEANSFVMTLQKDIASQDNEKIRVNLKKILILDEMIKKAYKKIFIELNSNFDPVDLEKILHLNGETEVNLVINNNKKNLIFKLEKTRKVDLSALNTIKTREYVKKISF